jgi:hypothetical protein
MYDIIAMIWFYSFHCKFVSKKELGKWNAFYNCNGGSALIDRKDPKQVPEIKN